MEVAEHHGRTFYLRQKEKKRIKWLLRKVMPIFYSELIKAAATMNPNSGLFLISYSVFRGVSDDAVGHEYGKVRLPRYKGAVLSVTLVSMLAS